MAQLLSCQSISKSYSSRPLFRGITFNIDDAEKLGLIGPNGAGKSTLLKLLAGIGSPDDGTIVSRKFLRIAYVPQSEKFDAQQTVLHILEHSLPDDTEPHERETRANIMATQLGLDVDALAGSLSGGWQKRLSIGCQLIRDPELLLLDEPTNHLDLHGVLWLEKLLQGARFSFVLVTHDRVFLENVCNRIVELNPVYADGYLSVQGRYSDFLLGREQYLTAQAHLEQALASKVRREVEWLRRGARARQKKAQSRIDEAGRIIGQHSEVKSRNAQTSSIDVEFSASGRKTKELLVAKGLKKSMGGKLLFEGLDMILRPGTRVGVLGDNGSGKTTLLTIISNHLKPDAGTLKRADQLRVVKFDQNRAQLDQTKTLKEALCPSGDSVVFQERSVHVATWARRFLFRSDQLNMPISYLSGGEQSRILIANLMLVPADVLILDEPTNDLDIPSLEVLEESLLEFPGAIILVTHDRYMLDNVSNVILALDGRGKATYYADYEQWETYSADASEDNNNKATSEKRSKSEPSKPVRKGLSTNEKRELATIEETIAAAEADVEKVSKKLSDPAIASNHVELQKVMDQVADAQKKVEKLYERWQDLEERNAMAAEMA